MAATDQPVIITDHRKGLAITAIGGLALTVDIPLIKLAGGDVWSILFLRTATTFAVSLLIWLAWRWLRGSAPPLVPGRAGIAVAFLYAVTSLCFVAAVFHTSTANLVFIVAFSTVFSALLSWLFLGDRPRMSTIVAMAVMIGAIAIIVGDGIGQGTTFGDMLALGAAFFLAGAITTSRASGRDMGFTSLVAVALPMLLAGIVVAAKGLDVAAPGWIILNGALVMPIAFFCLATGPRYITAPEVAMFYLLETVLAPIWVWLIFSETPSQRSLVGGALLIAALFGHSAWQLHQGRKRRLAAIRRPL